MAARNKDLYSELWPAMSEEACQTAYDGKVPALKTLLTNPATRAAIDQLFWVPDLPGVSMLKLIVVLLHHLPPHRCFSYPLLRACARRMRGCGSGCVLHVSGSMCAYAYDTCAHMLVGVLVSLNLLKFLLKNKNFVDW